jgi:hypothetical protein
MVGYVEVKDSTPLEAQNEEHINDAKRRSGHHIEVNCKGLVQMIAQERCPSLPRTRWRRADGHVARNGDFRDIETQLEQFPMDPRSTPPNIHFCHLDNQLANFRRNSRSSRAPSSALPSPEELESLAMPGQNGGWLHHGQALPPTIPEAGEQQPEDTIDKRISGSLNGISRIIASARMTGKNSNPAVVSNNDEAQGADFGVFPRIFPANQGTAPETNSLRFSNAMST